MKIRSENNESMLKICNSSRLNIYGAGVMGKTLYKCLSEAPYHKKVTSFIVKDTKDNPLDIEGIPVVDIPAAKALKEELLLIALHEKYIKNAVDDLKAAGFINFIPVSFDSDLWEDIRYWWASEHPMTEGIRLTSLDESLRKTLSVYVVHSEADQELIENPPEHSFEIPIQAGAALSEHHPFLIRDDRGDNISKKNKQYCELTALYYIWKNDRSDYVGLSHYRRRFQLSEIEVGKLVMSDIDVVVTVPIFNLNTVRGQYGLDHDICDWDIMLEGIERLYPEYSVTADKIQQGNFYYAYNMFIAKREILNNYCKWLFDILDYCEKRILKKMMYTKNGMRDFWLNVC